MHRWRRIGEFVVWRLRTSDHRTLFLLAILIVASPVGAVSSASAGRRGDVLWGLGLLTVGVAAFLAPLLFHRLWIQGWKPGGRHSAEPRLPWRHD